MSSWLVTLTADSGAKVDVELKDTIGPFNDWGSRTAGAFSIDGDVFTNQTGKVVARGCGANACWILDNLDIDTTHVGADGSGVNNDAQGTFPAGDLRWKVKSQL